MRHSGATFGKLLYTTLPLTINRQNIKRAFPSSFNINDKQECEYSKIANAFNTFYKNIGKTTTLNVPISRNHFSYYLRNRQKCSFFFEPVMENNVFNVVHKLKSKMGFGYDELPTKIVKLCINNILTLLTVS